MRRIIWKYRNQGLVALVSIGVLAGCENNTVAPKQQDELAELGPGFHPVLVLREQTGTTATIELHLKRVGITTAVASYQGELGFDTRLLTLSGAQLPEGVMGAWNEVEAGRLRFAGAALDGIRDGAVLVLSFATAGTLKEEAFTLKLEELIGTAAFQDLTPQVVSRERPLFSAAAVK